MVTIVINIDDAPISIIDKLMICVTRNRFAAFMKVLNRKQVTGSPLHLSASLSNCRTLAPFRPIPASFARPIRG